MDLPFLKNKHKMAGGGPVATIHAQTSDTVADDTIIDAVASEFLEAIEKKDVRALRQALEALVLHIKDMDESRDMEDEA